MGALFVASLLAINLRMKINAITELIDVCNKLLIGLIIWLMAPIQPATGACMVWVLNNGATFVHVDHTPQESSHVWFE